MKKKYEKPGLYVENFALSQGIATDCNVTRGEGTLGHPMLADKESCGWGDASLTVWIDASTNCNFEWGKDDPYEGVCYNNPNGGATIFNYS